MLNELFICIGAYAIATLLYYAIGIIMKWRSKAIKYDSVERITNEVVKELDFAFQIQADKEKRKSNKVEKE